VKPQAFVLNAHIFSFQYKSWTDYL